MVSRETPAALGYRMPAEWEPHIATWLSWPRREGISFPIHSTASCQLCGQWWKRSSNQSKFASTFATARTKPRRVRSSWITNGTNLVSYDPDKRAMVPGSRAYFFDARRSSEPGSRAQRARPSAIVDWDYNAWGNKYPPFDLDEIVPTRIAEMLKLPVFYPGMILEGGSIDVNGAGSVAHNRIMSLKSKSQSAPESG